MQSLALELAEAFGRYPDRSGFCNQAAHCENVFA